MRRGEVTLKNVPERPEILFCLINNRVGILMLGGGSGGGGSCMPIY